MNAAVAATARGGPRANPEADRLACEEGLRSASGMASASSQPGRGAAAEGSRLLPVRMVASAAKPRRAVAIPRSVRILIGSTLIDMRKSIDGPWPPCSRSSRARMGPS
jgi:hypothetical protein